MLLLLTECGVVTPVARDVGWLDRSPPKWASLQTPHSPPETQGHMNQYRIKDVSFQTSFNLLQPFNHLAIIIIQATRLGSPIFELKWVVKV